MSYRTRALELEPAADGALSDTIIDASDNAHCHGRQLQLES